VEVVGGGGKFVGGRDVSDHHSPNSWPRPVSTPKEEPVRDRRYLHCYSAEGKKKKLSQASGRGGDRCGWGDMTAFIFGGGEGGGLSRENLKVRVRS